MERKHTMVILIGSDGAGKSTIAAELSKILGYPVEHHGPVKSYEQGINQYLDSAMFTNYSVIKDRFYEGEAIYAPIYRGYDADYFNFLERVIMKRFHALLVQIKPPFDVIEKRLAERGEDFVKPEHFRYAYDKIDEVYQKSILPKYMIDTDKFTVEQNVEKIIDYLFGLQIEKF